MLRRTVKAQVCIAEAQVSKNIVQYGYPGNRSFVTLSKSMGGSLPADVSVMLRLLP